MSRVWRLVLDDACDGADNMALDRAMQIACERGDAPPTLRLYGWARPTLTLGRFQPTADIDLDACRRFRVDVVRRFTGGRGVVHDDELTYALVASVSDGLPRGVAASYRVLSEALADAYHRLGIEGAGIVESDGASARTGACYLATTRADLSLGAAKLSGSAQVWHGSTVLQHGSFVRSRDLAREAAVFGLDGEQTAALATKAATLENQLERVPSMDEIAEAVVGAFATLFGVTFEVGAVRAEEREIARELRSRALVHVDDIPSTSR